MVSLVPGCNTCGSFWVLAIPVQLLKHLHAHTGVHTHISVPRNADLCIYNVRELTQKFSDGQSRLEVNVVREVSLPSVGPLKISGYSEIIFPLQHFAFLRGSCEIAAAAAD